MQGFYFRWIVILLTGVIIALLGFWRYQNEVASMTPEELLQKRPDRTVRVLGTVRAGTLVREGSPGEARFAFYGAKDQVRVHYVGPENDNLRELKTMIVVGRFNTESGLLKATEFGVVPNYGFITAAYVVSIIPIGLFLFGMERRVRKLYTEIKGTTVYEPEKVFDEGL